jgi:two-component system sensor histidine kinase UhpB
MAAAPDPAPPLQPALDLQRSLLLRGVWLAGLLLAALLLVEGELQRRAAIAELPGTARLVTQILNEQLGRASGSFDRADLRLDLDALDGLAERLPLCLDVQSVHGRPIGHRCETPATVGATGRWLGARLRAISLDAQIDSRGREPQAEALLLIPPGIRAAVVVQRVPWPAVGQAWWQRARIALLLGLGLAIIVLAVTRPVGRALRPAQAILAALARLEAGDHGVRLPVPQLRELRDVAQRFNRLAERWQALLAEQQRLSARLLEVREEERRRLARDLHDELGQSLSALRAEAAVLALRPEAAAGERIGELGEQLMSGLQTVLDDLRPAALDRFGLAVALQALVAAPRRSRDGQPLACRLQISDAALDALPPAIAVHVYRIVQEALTNAARHGGARHTEVQLLLADGWLRITVDDDGRGTGPSGPEPGHGLLGMDERVQALGGRRQLYPRPGGGLRLSVELPLSAGAEP